MWYDFVQVLLFALGLSGVAFGIGKVVVHFGERSIERKHGIVGMRDLLVRRARLEQALEARRTQRVGDLKKAETALQEVARRRQRLDRQWTDARAAGDRQIRLIGEEVEGTPCYVAMVVNKYVGSGNTPRGPMLIDRTWVQPQTIEVWTRSLAEARAEVERRYPPAFGFNISRLHELGDSTAGAKGGGGSAPAA